MPPVPKEQLPPALRDYFDAPEISRKLGIDRSTVWRWVRRGVFPKPTYLTPSKPVWSAAAYAAWCDAREVA